MPILDQCLNENIFKPQCGDWARLNPVKANALRRSHCTADNMLKSECRAWVKSEPDKNRAAMTYFCQQQPFDEMCIDKSSSHLEVDQNETSFSFIIILIFMAIIAISIGKCLNIYYITKSHLKLS